MNLSEQAKTELREILSHDIGYEINNLNETEIEEFGLFLLSVGINSLKVRVVNN
jgi:hypothetical protein